jgi:predicted nucleotidyltransferase
LSEWIILSGLFGSVCSQKGNPSDCDLFVVSRARPGEEGWKELRETLREIKVEFELAFTLPLNVVLLTESEWVSEHPFFQGYRQLSNIDMR